MICFALFSHFTPAEVLIPKREFRLVAAVNAEARIHAVKRTVEKFRAIRDDKIRADGGIAQRPRGLVFKIASGVINQLRSKDSRAYCGWHDLRNARCAQSQSDDEKCSGHDGDFFVHSIMEKFASGPDAPHGSCN